MFAMLNHEQGNSGAGGFDGDADRKTARLVIASEARRSRSPSACPCGPWIAAPLRGSRVGANDGVGADDRLGKRGRAQGSRQRPDIVGARNDVRDVQRAGPPGRRLPAPGPAGRVAATRMRASGKVRANVWNLSKPARVGKAPSERGCMLTVRAADRRSQGGI